MSGTEGTGVEEETETDEAAGAPEALAPEHAAPEATAPEPAPADVPPRPARRLSLLQGVTALIVVLLVAAVIVSQWQLSDQRSLTADRASALSTATSFAIDVSSYDYRQLHQDFARVEAESTTSFAKNFVQSSGSLSKVLVQYKATAKAKVLAAGLVSISSSKAVVILFVNQTVTNTAQTNGPTVDNSRVRVYLVRSAGRWRLADLTVL